MKKLIIDIGEEEYENVLKFPDCYAFGYAIANGEPLKTELEEIKTEIINKKCKYCDIDSNIQKCHEDNFTICDVYDILDILDNHIKENK